MKKLVVTIGAMKRGSGLSSLSSLISQRPSCSSRVEKNAIELLSGDQRGLEAVQPEGSKGRDGVRRSGHSTGRRGEGEGIGVGYESRLARASQSVLTFLSSSTDETV